MEVLLDNKKKKLFDEAYQAYLNITRQIEELYSEGITNPFSDGPTVTDMICSLDKYIQGALLKIAFSDETLTKEKVYFISSLPDEFDEVCARTRGYKRFIKLISKESFISEGSKFFDFDNTPFFLEILCNDFSDAPIMVRSNLQIIFNAFIAIDGMFSEHQADTALELLDRIYNGDAEYRIAASQPESVPNSDNSRKLSEAIEKNLNNNAVEDNKKELDDALNELRNLIGLSGVKQEVMSCINLLRINNIRKEKGLPVLQTSNHMVFTGNPGTGKTTVARIMAKIYKCLGVVSKGQLVETDRSGMVAGYVGQTALKTAQVIKKARGGVLFIDEAYSLSSEDGSNDYGKEAIDTLVKGMEDYRDDLVVIAAGYENEMSKFISMNPGLKSRFNKYIHFENYSSEEMLEIFCMSCDAAHFILPEASQESAKLYFERNFNDPTFGNARGVRNFFDKIVMNQANRILEIANPTDDDFRTIIPEDINLELQ